MKILKELWGKIWRQLSSNSHWVLVITGVIFIIISEPVGGRLNEMFREGSFWGHITFDSVFHAIGVSILVSGVYAFLMKSVLFSNFYKNLFFDVIYAPHKKVDIESIKDKWKILSNSLLEGKVPFKSSQVTDRIMEDFLEKEVDYCFKNIEISFAISKVPGALNKVKVIQIFRAEVIFSKTQRKIVIKQKFESDKSTFKKGSVLINDKPISIKDYSIDRMGIVTLEYSIDNPQDYCHDDSHFGTLRFDRTHIRTQDIRNDPVIVGSYSRYIKGMSILIKTENVDYVLYKVGKDSCHHSIRDMDSSGFWHHVIADPNSLLLPGEGYTLTIVPLSERIKK